MSYEKMTIEKYNANLKSGKYKGSEMLQMVDKFLVGFDQRRDKRRQEQQCSQRVHTEQEKLHNLVLWERLAV